MIQSFDHEVYTDCSFSARAASNCMKLIKISSSSIGFAKKNFSTYTPGLLLFGSTLFHSQPSFEVFMRRISAISDWKQGSDEICTSKSMGVTRPLQRWAVDKASPYAKKALMTINKWIQTFIKHNENFRFDFVIWFPDCIFEILQKVCYSRCLARWLQQRR